MPSATLTTSFTRLAGCRAPIQLAGMPRITTVALAAAVADAGGAGMIGAGGMAPGTLDAELAALAAATGGVFGVNFLMPFLEREALDVAARRARLVEFFYGAPDAALVRVVHAGGALAGWQVGSREEALAAVEAGCDYLIAQGVEAGGHVRGPAPLLPLLADVLDAVAVPVLAAGGIATPRSLAAVLAAGAVARGSGPASSRPPSRARIRTTWPRSSRRGPATPC